MEGIMSNSNFTTIGVPIAMIGILAGLGLNLASTFTDASNDKVADSIADQSIALVDTSGMSVAEEFNTREDYTNRMNSFLDKESGIFIWSGVEGYRPALDAAADNGIVIKLDETAQTPIIQFENGVATLIANDSEFSFVDPAIQDLLQGYYDVNSFAQQSNQTLEAGVYIMDANGDLTLQKPLDIAAPAPAQTQGNSANPS